MSTNRQQSGIISFLQELVQRLDFTIQFNLNAGVLYLFYFGVDY